jgi:hypothetical protein
MVKNKSVQSIGHTAIPISPSCKLPDVGWVTMGLGRHALIQVPRQNKLERCYLGENISLI